MIRINIDKTNFRHWLALPFGLVALIFVCIAYFIVGEHVEVYYGWQE
jgi:hypothetical protein